MAQRTVNNVDFSTLIGNIHTLHKGIYNTIRSTGKPTIGFTAAQLSKRDTAELDVKLLYPVLPRPEIAG